MKFDIDFVLSIFVSQTLFAAIINLVDLIKTVINAIISKNFTIKNFYTRYAIYLSPFASFMFFFIIGIITSIILTTLRTKTKEECETEKRKKREAILNELKKPEGDKESLLIKYLALTNSLLN